MGVSERREGALARNQKSGTVFSIQTGKDERVFKLEGIMPFMLTKLIYKNSSGYCIERAYCVPGTPLGPLQIFLLISCSDSAKKCLAAAIISTVRFTVGFPCPGTHVHRQGSLFRSSCPLPCGTPLFLQNKVLASFGSRPNWESKRTLDSDTSEFELQLSQLCSSGNVCIYVSEPLFPHA